MRRDRLSLLLGLALALVGCDPARATPPAAGLAAVGTATPSVELSPAPADVWAHALRVSAALAPGRPENCWFDRDGRRTNGRADGAAFVADVPLEPGANRVSARCRDASGRETSSLTATYTVPGALGLVDAAMKSRRAPPRADPGDAVVVYGVIPPLYGHAPLRGLRDALPAIADLGVTTLWLSPIFRAAEGDYGYAVTDYFEVRPDYGTLAELRALVTDAHRHGLRVLLDLVPNHTSVDHPYFVQSQRLGRRSHHFSFYERTAEGAPTHYFDWAHLPNLDYDNAEVGRFVEAASLYWVTAAGVDGYRVDAAWAVAARAPGFFPEWSELVRGVNPSAFLLAEASASDVNLAGAGFSAAYDWTREIGKWAWEHVFTDSKGIARRLDAAVRRSQGDALEPGRVLRFLNNNDTGARFVSRHGVPLTRVATVLLLTLPGIPCLYAFDEVGAEYEPYSELHPIAEAPYPELRPLHRSLVRLRRASPSLRGGSFTPLFTGKDTEGYAYLREAGDGAEFAVVALNFGAVPTTVRLPLPEAFDAPPAVRDALNGGSTAPLPPSIALPPFGYTIWIGERPEERSGSGDRGG